MQSTFLLTVPQHLYDAFCDACDQPFADSYLFGAVLHGDQLTPRTLTGFFKMKERHDCMKLLGALRLKLHRPTPWPGEGDRPSHEECWAGRRPPEKQSKGRRAA